MWNEEIRHRGIDKNGDFPETSFYAFAKRAYPEMIIH
jgi:hypothetical protein